MGKENRGGERATTSMRIKLKYPDVDTFIQKYAVNISRGGIFISTRQPKPVGTPLRFEFLLADPAGTSIIRGEGQVQWTREYDPAQPSRAHGMGVKFTRLDAESQTLIDRALAWRAQQGGAKRDSEGIPVQPRAPSSSQPVSVSTPLPTPLPARPEPEPDPEPPTQVAAPTGWPSGRPDEHTRPVAIADPPPKREPGEDEETLLGRPRDVITREISLPDGPHPNGEDSGELRLSDDSVKITLDRYRRANGRAHGDQLDELAAEWGLSQERLERVLRRRRPRMVEATAELERLLTQPPKAPTPSKAEAMARLAELLAKRERSA